MVQNMCVVQNIAAISIMIKSYSKKSFGINIGLFTYRSITMKSSYRPALASTPCKKLMQGY